MDKHIICKCPDCSGDIIEFSRFYGCENWRPIDGNCKFTLPKNFSGRDISSIVARELIQNRQSRKLCGFKSKKGQEFSACLELVWNGEKWRLKMRFED